MTPLFEHKTMGGAQKQLRKVVVHLAKQGHKVTLVCTRRDPAAVEPFQWHENALFVPVFRFKQPFPEPYAVPIHDIAHAVQRMGDYLRDADVFYNHDGGFLLPYVSAGVPTVYSLRSIIFSETLVSGYLFQGDDLIVISEHQRDSLLNTVGRFFPGLAARTHTIYNGLDFDEFKPTSTDAIRTYIPNVDPAQHAIALFPHRPEGDKGIREVIEAARLLVHTHNIDNLRVLVPQWIDVSYDPVVQAFYAGLNASIDEYGLREHFVFHEWVPEGLIPAYYSLGGVTFGIGRYVETFGNVPYESLACGTPSIVARVGPARELLPEDLIDKVDYGDIEGAAEIAARVLKSGARTSAQTLDYLKAHFQQDDMVQAYADVILNAAGRGPMPYQHTPLTDDTRFVLAPWCYLAPQPGRMYHDFRAEWQTNTPLWTRLQDAPEQGVCAADFAAGEVMRLYTDGWLVPLPG